MFPFKKEKCVTKEKMREYVRLGCSLSTEEKAQIEKHLKRCGKCRQLKQGTEDYWIFIMHAADKGLYSPDA